MKIYTKTGDEGFTSLVGGTRIDKSHVRIEAYGTVDELNSSLGYLLALGPDGAHAPQIEAIQQQLQHRLPSCHQFAGIVTAVLPPFAATIGREHRLFRASHRPNAEPIATANPIYTTWRNSPFSLGARVSHHL